MIDRYALPAMKAVWTEEAKFNKWLAVELAVCEAYHRRGQIPPNDYATITSRARFNVRRIEAIEAEVNHDVIAFLTAVAEEVGEASRFIHLGLTSSDVVDTGLSLQLVEAAQLLLTKLDQLLTVLGGLALRHRDTFMMGRTHGVHAEPTTFGLKVALWYEEMRRNRDRLIQAEAEIRVGKLSGAVGNFANIDPAIQDEVCTQLGLASARISNQIIQRDRHAAFMTTLAILASSIEKIAVTLRGLQITELNEVEEPFGLKQKGSSAMPHKKNPILCERLCGLARIVRSFAQVSLENIPLWHERDISHSSAERIIFPDACILTDYLLNKLTWLLDNLVVHKENMKQNIEAAQGLYCSQRVLLKLVEKGLTREVAYRVVQHCAMQAREQGKQLQVVLMENQEIRAVFSVDEIASLFQLNYYLRHVKSIFSRLGLLEKEEILHEKR